MAESNPTKESEAHWEDSSLDQLGPWANAWSLIWETPSTPEDQSNIDLEESDKSGKRHGQVRESPDVTRSSQ